MSMGGQMPGMGPGGPQMAMQGRNRTPRPGFMQQIKGDYEPGQGESTAMQNLSRALQGRPELEGADQSPYSQMKSMLGGMFG
jgi:hypothetical protein